MLPQLDKYWLVIKCGISSLLLRHRIIYSWTFVIVQLIRVA